MSALALHIVGLLRAGLDQPVGSDARRLRKWGTIFVLAGLGYGAVMGLFGGVAGGRILQVVYSAVKVPMLLLVTFGVSLPSFFVLNTLLGMRADFREVLGALTAAQAGLTVVLLALAPYTALWYVSFAGYEHALLFNGAMFALASIAAQGILWRCYQRLIARNPRHRVLLRAWLGIYVFVGVQSAWVLRPFIGSPAMPVEFFRHEAWGNAYEVVVRLIWRVVREWVSS